MHNIEVIAGLLIGVGILSAMVLMIVGMVVYSVPGRLAQGQTLMGTGATVALWTIGLGCAAATIVHIVKGGTVEWKGVVHFVAVLAVTFVVVRIAKRYRKK